MEKFDSRVDTLLHIRKVQAYIYDVVEELLYRSLHHDDSKLKSPELETYDEFTPKLSSVEYGSDEYKQFLEDMGPALEHHYKNNPHHPNFYDNGIKGMNLIDLIEMFCDWKAASKRVKSGDVRKSIEMNQSRYNYSDDLKAILLNTENHVLWTQGDLDD